MARIRRLRVSPRAPGEAPPWRTPGGVVGAARRARARPVHDLAGSPPRAAGRRRFGAMSTDQQGFVRLGSPELQFSGDLGWRRTRPTPRGDRDCVFDAPPCGVAARRGRPRRPVASHQQAPRRPDSVGRRTGVRADRRRPDQSRLPCRCGSRLLGAPSDGTSSPRKVICGQASGVGQRLALPASRGCRRLLPAGQYRARTPGGCSILTDTCLP